MVKLLHLLFWGYYFYILQSKNKHLPTSDYLAVLVRWANSTTEVVKKFPHNRRLPCTTQQRCEAESKNSRQQMVCCPLYMEYTDMYRKQDTNSVYMPHIKSWKKSSAMSQEIQLHPEGLLRNTLTLFYPELLVWWQLGMETSLIKINYMRKKRKLQETVLNYALC